MKLQEIAWPVYKLGDGMPSEKDGILFYAYEKRDSTIIKVIDDKNLPAESLAGRRLKLMIDQIPLFKLKIAIFFLGDLVKVAKASMWFIDSRGSIFQYKKSKFTTLTCKKITKIIPSVSCTLIEVEGVMARFKVLFPPLLEQKYVGLLKLKSSYIVYGFYEYPFKDTVRKI